MNNRHGFAVVMSASILLLIAIAFLFPEGRIPIPMSEATPASSGWQPQWTAAQSRTFPFETSISLAITRDGDLWATAPASFDQTDQPPEKYSQVLRYSPISGKIVTYTNTFEGNLAYPRALHVSRQGTLWLLAWSWSDPRQGPLVPGNPRGQVLWYYNPARDRFVPVQDANQVLRSFLTASLDEDPQGNLWFVMGADPGHPEVVRYNPGTNEAMRVAGWRKDKAESTASSLACAPDGSVWIVGDQKMVVQYDPVSGAVTDRGMPPGDEEYVHGLYFDRTGRLWMTSIAWMDFPVGREPGWHAVVKPELFMREVHTSVRSDNPGRWEWTEPYEMYESSDGRMWFASLAGLIQYDSKKDEWQKSAPFQSAVVEDKNGYLWAAANSQFYRYQLKP
jgi:ligand-binding sensor domain-containing protein